MKKHLAALLFACAAPTPGIVSYHPHMPAETQRQIADGALRQLLPKFCAEYEFESPEKIECRQSLQYQYGGNTTKVDARSDLSCSQLDGIHAYDQTSPTYFAVLRGDHCERRVKVNFLFGDERADGKCIDNIEWHVPRRNVPMTNAQIREDAASLARDFYEALYAYCTSHGYQIQLYGSPELLFGERRY